MQQPKRRNISQRSELIYDAHCFGIILDTRELFLNSSFDADEEIIDYKCANTFIRNLQILNSMGSDPILIHMATCGGIHEYGMAIYDAIRASKSDITILTYAHARSMSSIIPQAAKWRIIMPNADFLIHYGTWENPQQNFQSIVSEVNWSQKQTEQMLDIYVGRCKEGAFWQRENMEEKEIKKWLKDNIASKQELYMSPKESVDKGFMDAIFGDEEFEDFSALRD